MTLEEARQEAERALRYATNGRPVILPVIVVHALLAALPPAGEQESRDGDQR